MMRVMNALKSLVLAGLVAACGGGGSDAGTSPFGGGDNPPGSSTAADLVVVLSKSTIFNTGNDTVTVTTTAIDASRNTVTGAPVTVSADSDAIVAAGGTTTGSDGNVSATLSIGPNRSNRLITVTVVSGSISKTATVSVVGAKISGTVVPAVVAPGAAGKVEFRLLDQAGNAMVDEEITVVATGLTPANATGRTGANGQYDFTFTAPTGPGPYTVTATGGGATTDPAPIVQVQSASSVDPVTTAITSASVSANPSVVGVNIGTSTANRSEIRALFLGANNQPIRNVRVKFDLAGDVNSIGGTFTSGTATLYSDANGIATTAYVPGSRSSPTDGVTVRACYGVSDTDPALTSCTRNATIRLTVTNEPLGVSIGTNELIVVNELTYVKKFVVSVADAAGNALQDVNLVASVDLENYRKGFYQVVSGRWTKISDWSCVNEDGNRNGVLEDGEDLDDAPNGRLPRLDPGKSDVTVRLLQTKTRADGTAELEVQYAKSFGTWVDVKITVAASGISGTEGRATWLMAPVPVNAESILNTNLPPAYVRSPYGVVASCFDPD
jgi:hypothetical protein